LFLYILDITKECFAELLWVIVRVEEVHNNGRRQSERDKTIWQPRRSTGHRLLRIRSPRQDLKQKRVKYEKMADTGDLMMEDLAKDLVMKTEMDHSLNLPGPKESHPRAAHHYYHGGVGLRGNEWPGGECSSPRTKR
jgi:hypothetical protein